MSADPHKALADHIATLIASWSTPFRAGFGFVAGGMTAFALIRTIAALIAAGLKALFA